MMTDESLSPGKKGMGLTIPAFILSVALIIMTGFQTTLLLKERSDLKKQLTRQDPIVEQSRKMRSQLDSIAKRTAILSKNGNANARAIVDQLKKAGITINIDADSNKNTPSQ